MLNMDLIANNYSCLNCCWWWWWSKTNVIVLSYRLAKLDNSTRNPLNWTFCKTKSKQCSLDDENSSVSDCFIGKYNKPWNYGKSSREATPILTSTCKARR